MTVQESVNQLNKELTNMGLGLNRAFFQNKPKQKEDVTMKEIQDMYNWTSPTATFAKGGIVSEGFWPVLTDLDYYQANIRPYNAQQIREKLAKHIVENPIFKSDKEYVDTITEQAYKIDELEREVKLHKDSLLNYQNKVSVYTSDYARLEVDYLNSQSENRKLKERLTELENIESDYASIVKQFSTQLDKTVQLQKELKKWN